MRVSCKIFVVMSVLMGFVLCSSFAQKGKTAKTVDSTIVEQGNIPAEVAKSFKKRFASATDVVWRLIEGNYVAECTAKNIPTEAVFQKDGVWLSTMEELDPNSIPGPCMKSINAYYPKCMLNSYKRKTENNKELTFIIGMYESQNIKKKLETIVMLDKSGIILRTIEPDESVETVVAPEEENVSDKKKAKIEAKTKKEMEKEEKMGSNPVKISENELPYDLLRWVLLRYPDYVYKEILYLEDPDFEDEGNIYRINIQRSGVGQSATYATLWFTRDGYFLKVEDPFHTEDELQQIAQNTLDAEKIRSGQDDKSKSKGNAKAVEDKTPRITMVDTEEVPEEYTLAMKQKYPKAKEVAWGEDELGNFIAYYTDQAGKNEVFFEKTDSVKWLETKSPIADLNKVSFAVRSAVEKDFSKQVSIKQAWNVKSAVVKPYVIVELYDKKDRTTETVEFWQTGKYKTMINREKPEVTIEKTVEKKEEKPSKSKVKAKQEEPEEEQIQLVGSDKVPEEYVSALKLKYPRAKDVKWGEDGMGGWTAFYTDQAGMNEVFFETTDSVKWLETKTSIADLNKVPFSIQGAVEKNYPKQVSIKRAWNVRSAVVKPYIIIELYNKKDKSTETIEFWQTGKPKN